jgi:hypothetical protein
MDVAQRRDKPSAGERGKRTQNRLGLYKGPHETRLQPVHDNRALCKNSGNRHRNGKRVDNDNNGDVRIGGKLSQRNGLSAQEREFVKCDQRATNTNHSGRPSKTSIDSTQPSPEPDNHRGHRSRDQVPQVRAGPTEKPIALQYIRKVRPTQTQEHRLNKAKVTGIQQDRLKTAKVTGTHQEQVTRNHQNRQESGDHPNPGAFC